LVWTPNWVPAQHWCLVFTASIRVSFNYFSHSHLESWNKGTDHWGWTMKWDHLLLLTLLEVIVSHAYLQVKTKFSWYWKVLYNVFHPVYCVLKANCIAAGGDALRLMGNFMKALCIKNEIKLTLCYFSFLEATKPPT
jgi:hypothetical protein